MSLKHLKAGHDRYLTEIEKQEAKETALREELLSLLFGEPVKLDTPAILIVGNIRIKVLKCEKSLDSHKTEMWKYDLVVAPDTLEFRGFSKWGTADRFVDLSDSQELDFHRYGLYGTITSMGYEDETDS